MQENPDTAGLASCLAAPEIAMCGRFDQYLPRMRGLVALLDEWPGDQRDRINICPTQSAGTIGAEGFRERHWSLIPRWAKVHISTYLLTTAIKN